MSTTTRNCDNCGKTYEADNRNLKRGWGLCCSKSCAAKKRERSKPGYDPQKVEINNQLRESWVDDYYNEYTNYLEEEDPGDSMYWDSKDY